MTNEGNVEQLDQLMKDLEVLCDGPFVDLHLAFDGAVIFVQSNDRTIWRDSAIRGWMAVDGRARARHLLSWFHQAAEIYRNRLKRKSKKKDVA